MTDHEVDTSVTRLQPGTLVDITIRDVRIVDDQQASVFARFADEHGDVYALPPQAAIKRANLSAAIDAATLQERVSSTLAAIDRMCDEQTLDPWQAHWLRKQLDPNPRNWPPQPGDVWDDGMPFGGSLWFTQLIDNKGSFHLAMLPVERGPENTRATTPDELLASGAELKLVYRRKDGDQ